MEIFFLRSGIGLCLVALILLINAQFSDAAWSLLAGIAMAFIGLVLFTRQRKA
jgi:hypothetical protein